MISEDDKRRIDAEERYRFEVRKQLGPIETRSFADRVINFVVAAFVTWYMAALVIAVVVAIYFAYFDQPKKSKKASMQTSHFLRVAVLIFSVLLATSQSVSAQVDTSSYNRPAGPSLLDMVGQAQQIEMQRLQIQQQRLQLQEMEMRQNQRQLQFEQEQAEAYRRRQAIGKNQKKQ